MKVKVFVLLASVAASTVIFPIATAGAATGTVCKTETGSFTFSPTLPKEGSPKRVNGAAHWKGKLGGCSNGVSGGSLTGTGKFHQSNCTVSLHTKGVTTAKITWKSGAGTSTIRFSGTPTSDGAKFAGTVTSGRFKGTHITMPLLWVTLSPQGACGTAGLKTIVFKSKAAVHI
jgi:hypothetical protein